MMVHVWRYTDLKANIIIPSVKYHLPKLYFRQHSVCISIYSLNTFSLCSHSDICRQLVLRRSYPFVSSLDAPDDERVVLVPVALVDVHPAAVGDEVRATVQGGVVKKMGTRLRELGCHDITSCLKETL